MPTAPPDAEPAVQPVVAVLPGAEGGHAVEQVRVPAQTFLMGDAHGDGRWGDGETPVHAVALDAFDVDATSVTNDDFGRFVADTGFRTEAETFGYSAVFHLALAADQVDVLGQPPQTPWWFGVRGADWRHPGGPRSSVVGLGDHPVVHVSWNDAVAYCDWAGRALPTEAQWEAASRGGLQQARYPWGDDLGATDGDGRAWRVNVFQGTFPTSNTLDDGHLTTAPVRSYQPNAYGVWQTVGNVWEWCSDVFDVRTYERDAAAGTVTEPSGPAAATPETPRVMRGGSYLCHDSYCNRYRNAARSQNTPDSSMGNAGFRTVSRAVPVSGSPA
ncbi:sulfatase modifying factor 1 (C-alpha-formyglycine- generating enzyme 1) [Curtobacterium sp. MCBA15_001]|nr:sulfatase modifying factor 1 (C-alpha-formyglycine- generating enzyme 1) [Curtobacterium sp. MCBA15_001]